MLDGVSVYGGGWESLLSLRGSTRTIEPPATLWICPGLGSQKPDVTKSAELSEQRQRTGRCGSAGRERKGMTIFHLVYLPSPLPGRKTRSATQEHSSKAGNWNARYLYVYSNCLGGLGEWG